MESLKRFFFLGFLLALLVGCSNTASDTLGDIDIADAMRELETIKLSEIADNIAYVPLEINDSCLLS